ncbi:MAG: NAD(P)H-binding protein [Roseiflexaceae bacterium]|nr:NAD(P)H-binding protein [Roseiflexaceae bacterium]
MNDELQSVDLVRQSNLDWTVVRAPALNDKPATGSYRIGTEAGSSITRSDVAAFILSEVKQARYIRKLPLVGN